MNNIAKNKILGLFKNLDIFSLGNAAFIRVLLMYFLAPLFAFVGLPSKYIYWLTHYGGSFYEIKVMAFLMLAIVFFVLGYNISLSSKKPSSIGSEWRLQRLAPTFWIVFLIGVTTRLIRILFGGYFHLNQSLSSSSFYGLIGFLDTFSYIALLLALISYYSLRTKGLDYKKWQIISWLVFFLNFAYGFLSGSRMVTVAPIVIFLMVRHYLFKVDILRVAIVAVAVVIVLFPTMNYIRSPLGAINGYLNGNNEIGLISKFSNITQYASDSSMNRLDQSYVMSKIFENTKSFLYGKTFLNLIISLGPPRIIWHNKPAIWPNGNLWGREIGILNPEDSNTSVAPTFVGDLYINFGLPGIIFGMFLFGLIFRWIYDYLVVSNGAKFSALMIYVIVWINLIKDLENWIAPILAGLIKIVVVLLVIHLCLTWTSKRELAPSTQS